MFSKRRYNRKKNNRKPYKARVSKKRQILRPQNSASHRIEPPTPQFDAAGVALYHWTFVKPVRTASHAKIEIPKFSSLRLICATQVALDADALSEDYLDEGLWSSCWSHVWQCILKMGKDLPDVFRMFARKFGNELLFRCHRVTDDESESLARVRNEAIRRCRLPSLVKHRMDNVFCNISMDDFVRFLAGFDGAIALDCSNLGVSLSFDQLIQIVRLPNLRALDLSGCDLVSDQFLYTLKSCLTERDTGLEVLTLVRCPITSKGLTQFLQSIGQTKLCFVECDHIMHREIFLSSVFSLSGSKVFVPGLKFYQIRPEDSNAKYPNTYPAARKLYFLLRNLSGIQACPTIWDIKFHPQLHDPLGSKEQIYVNAWNSRQTAVINSPILTLARDDSVKAEQKFQPSPTVPHPQIADKLEEVTPRSKTDKRPRIRVSDARSFFGS